MGLFSLNESNTNPEDMVQDMDALVEAFMYDDLSRLSEEDRKAFVESSEANTLIDEGMITKRTVVRLSKQDDIDRRETIAAMQMAKEKHDPLWDKFVKYRTMEKDVKRQIKKKYFSKAKKSAVVGQKAYLKKNKGLGAMFAKMPSGMH